MKINNNDVNKYGGDSLANFFSLSQNGETANVRFLYETVDDIELYAVHQVQLSDGSYRYVNCLKESYESPEDDCPLCARGRETKNFSEKRTLVKLWVPVLNVDEDEVQVWERGKTFYNKQLLPLMSKYGEPFCGNSFTVTRIGEPGDKKTRYDIVFTDSDDKIIDDFGDIDIPCVDGTIILNKNFDELNNFVRTRTFDGSGTEEEERPERRSAYNGESASERKSRRPNMI